MLEEQTAVRNWSSMLRISKSQIQTYLVCPRKFFFQYVIVARWEFMPASLPFGRALHAAVAAFYRFLKETGERPQLDSITQEFTDTGRSRPLDNICHSRERRPWTRTWALAGYF